MLASVKKCKGAGNSHIQLVHYGMRLRRRTILVLIGLVIVSVIGIISVQVYLLKNTYDQKEEAFRQSVGSVLAGVNDGLETRDVVSDIFAAGLPLPLQGPVPSVVSVHTKTGDTTATRLLLNGTPHLPSLPLKIAGDTLSYSVTRPQRVSIHVFDMLGREDTTVVDTFRQRGVYHVKLSPDKYSRGEYFYTYLADSSSFIIQMAQGKQGGIFVRENSLRHKEKVVRDVVEQLVTARRPSLESRVKPGILDSLLRSGMKEAEIDLPFAFGVQGSRPDTLRFVSQQGFADELRTSEFRARLFPGDVFAARNDLVLFFPGRRLFLLRSMAPMLGATALFIGGIIFAFAYTMKTIFRQKKLSETLVEFINNMTHEFKTPISTIALASEAIARDDVLAEKERVLRYNGIIHDENVRMKQQVDKILQMAVLEEGDYELTMTPVDVHDVIRKAVENMALQVERKTGRITCRLEADSCIVMGDAVHLANIIHNVLDNANKYSREQPRIEVSTRNTGDMLAVAVRDEGIGMKEEDARRAFEKYFRVSTGNQHDVKGFGLGLSYVKLMMEVHKGTASIRSLPGKGTTVDLVFPVAGSVAVL